MLSQLPLCCCVLLFKSLHCHRFSHIWEKAREKCAQPSVCLGPICAFVASISESLCVRYVRVSFLSSEPDLSPGPHLPWPPMFS